MSLIAAVIVYCRLISETSDEVKPPPQRATVVFLRKKLHRVDPPPLDQPCKKGCQMNDQPILEIFSDYI
ncbi:MAG: hypothetical protein ABIL58_11835 [Pseudomonadota bacterium]